MFEGGLVEEVQSLISSGVPATAKAFQAHGYRRVVEYLQDRRSREDALNQMKLDTRHYAKRQLTWWRGWPDVKWVHRFGDEPEAFAEASQYLKSQFQCEISGLIYACGHSFIGRVYVQLIDRGRTAQAPGGCAQEGCASSAQFARAGEPVESLSQSGHQRQGRARL